MLNQSPGVNLSADYQSFRLVIVLLFLPLLLFFLFFLLLVLLLHQQAQASDTVTHPHRGVLLPYGSADVQTMVTR